MPSFGGKTPNKCRAINFIKSFNEDYNIPTHVGLGFKQTFIKVVKEMEDSMSTNDGNASFFL
jgi:hypothetical protein